MSENQDKKEKKWLFFAIGLIAGFAISVVSFVIFSMIQNNTKSITKTFEHIYKPENSKDTIVKYVNVVSKESSVNLDKTKSEISDSLLLANNEERFDEVEFSYSGESEPINEDVVVVDKMLSQKKVKVQCKDADFKDIAPVEGVIDYIDVQQWNTPIKNRITYYLSGNVLQVKGIAADKVEVVYYDQQYYLCYGGNYYRLRSNADFEKLGSPVVLAVQK